MRIFIAGADSAIGRRLLKQLIVRGHEVVASTRSRDEVLALCSLGAHAVVMDVLDAGSVGETVARAEPEAVIQLLPVGTDHLLAAAAAVGARFVALDLDDVVSAAVAALERGASGVYRVGVTGVPEASSQKA